MTSSYKHIIPFTLLLISLFGCIRTARQSVNDVQKLLEKGQLTEAINVTDQISKSIELSSVDRAKIDSILEICQRIRIDYTLTEDQVLNKLVVYQPKIDTFSLSLLEKEHKLDMLSLDGKKIYFKNSVSNLFLLDSSFAKLKSKKDGFKVDAFPKFKLTHTSDIITKTNVSGKPVHPVKMILDYTIRVKPNAVPPGDTIRCWMPFPRENHRRQLEVRLLQTEPGVNKISPSSDLQRSIYLESISVANQPTVFHSSIEYTALAQYFPLTPGMIKPYQKESLIFKEFTSEKPPQIIFSSKIKSLAENILQKETNPLVQVQKIYKWINDSVTWASALEYSIMPDIPGFVIENRHGDCGMQTLLFMTLARSVGIPVKWQSGWMLHPGEVNLHDWCEVYYEGIGWVPLDQSFGLQNSTDERIRDFYISGIDAYRLIVNDDISSQFTPGKKYFRSEPYDFQRGELEWKGGNLYFDKWSWHMEVTYK
jgi:hypothetical protein